jgi:FkbM family methyltransferase
VLAIEAQERIYYALAGNIAINNCFNAVALNAAVTDKPGMLRIPQPDYLMPASFGSLELCKRENTEPIGQLIDYSDESLKAVQAITIDMLKLPRIDFIKIDVEGMELEVLAGAAESIAQHHPAILVEWIKTGAAALREWLAIHDYKIFDDGGNLFAIHNSDPILSHIH